MATELLEHLFDLFARQNADVIDRISSGDPHALASLFAAAGVTVTATKVAEAATAGSLRSPPG